MNWALIWVVWGLQLLLESLPFLGLEHHLTVRCPMLRDRHIQVGITWILHSPACLQVWQEQGCCSRWIYGCTSSEGMTPLEKALLEKASQAWL